MAGDIESVCTLLEGEFDKWLNKSQSEIVFLIRCFSHPSGTACLTLLLDAEYEVKLHCPPNYPNHDKPFHVEVNSSLRNWCHVLNESLSAASTPLTLSEVLDRVTLLYAKDDAAVTQITSSKPTHSSPPRDGRQSSIPSLLESEFDEWLNRSESEIVFLIDCIPQSDGSACMDLLVDSEYEIKLRCPPNYPNHDKAFQVEGVSSLKSWCGVLNENLRVASRPLMLSQVLDQATSLYVKDDFGTKHAIAHSSSEDEEYEAGFDDIHENSCDDKMFTTDWELHIAQKQKLWFQKEAQLRKKLKQEKSPISDIFSSDNVQPHQIFSNSAASRVLVNDLVSIMADKDCGIAVEPVDNNIYLWSVRISKFDVESKLGGDVVELSKKFGYGYVELVLTFQMDLYPFYPPLVKFVRPRLQGCEGQQPVSFDVLRLFQLSYWSPARDMKSVLLEVKSFLQQYARVVIDDERNDGYAFPEGAFLELEHLLLLLSTVTEVNPRGQTLMLDSLVKQPIPVSSCSTGTEQFWAKGTGYGHGLRPGWDVDASIAAQREKDRQIERVLNHILKELKKLRSDDSPTSEQFSQYLPGSSTEGLFPGRGDVNGACSSSTSQISELDMSADSECDISLELKNQQNVECKPIPDVECSPVWPVYKVNAMSTQSAMPSSTSLQSTESDAGDKRSVASESCIYSVIEDSALLPFLEQQLQVDSFLEICRHTELYTVVVNILQEFSCQAMLLPLFSHLKNQKQSLLDCISQLAQKASFVLEQLEKVSGNGCIPGMESKTGGCGKENGSCFYLSKESIRQKATAEQLSEAKLAKAFMMLHGAVLDSMKRHGHALGNGSPCTLAAADDSFKSADEDRVAQIYVQCLKPLQYESHQMETKGPKAHYFSLQFEKHGIGNQKQVMRVAQELASLATSLPLHSSSAIFVRTDEDKIPLMRALVTGPEGTPYASGCFLFDIFFPPSYPSIPPSINLQTTGGGRVRFNPNLYANGKVCLSLLGTWEGLRGERWHETSTVLQVLVSIQSLIMISEPYFNEPGFERQIGTDKGRERSKEYNIGVQCNTIKYAILDQLNNPSPGFEEVIKAHFYIKRHKILQEVEGWVNAGQSNELKQLASHLKHRLKTLDPPNEDVAKLAV